MNNDISHGHIQILAPVVKKGIDVRIVFDLLVESIQVNNASPILVVVVAFFIWYYWKAAHRFSQSGGSLQRIVATPKIETQSESLREFLHDLQALPRWRVKETRKMTMSVLSQTRQNDT